MENRKVPNHKSEVARILAEIDAEVYAANLALAAYAITSNHAFITLRMEMMAEHKQELDELIGEEKATELFVARLEILAGDRKYGE